jgi:hypothetical protein
MFDFFKISYIELIKLSPNPTYRELLNTTEWATLRTSIIERDRKCCKCNVTIEGNENNYYRKLTFEEKAVKDKEWEDYPGVDLFGDGRFYKGQKPDILGVPLIVQIHHKYYIKGKLPWEYDVAAMVCVCRDCHVKVHLEEDILIYSDETLTMYKKVDTCLICEGTGYRPEYDYYQNGICFHCDGKGFRQLIILR